MLQSICCRGDRRNLLSLFLFRLTTHSILPHNTPSHALKSILSRCYAVRPVSARARCVNVRHVRSILAGDTPTPPSPSHREGALTCNQRLHLKRGLPTADQQGAGLPALTLRSIPSRSERVSTACWCFVTSIYRMSNKARNSLQLFKGWTGGRHQSP